MIEEIELSQDFMTMKPVVISKKSAQKRMHELYELSMKYGFMPLYVLLDNALVMNKLGFFGDDICVGMFTFTTISDQKIISISRALGITEYTLIAAFVTTHVLACANKKTAPVKAIAYIRQFSELGSFGFTVMNAIESVHPWQIDPKGEFGIKMGFAAALALAAVMVAPDQSKLPGFAQKLSLAMNTSWQRKLLASLQNAVLTAGTIDLVFATLFLVQAIQVDKELEWLQNSMIIGGFVVGAALQGILQNHPNVMRRYNLFMSAVTPGLWMTGLVNAFFYIIPHKLVDALHNNSAFVNPPYLNVLLATLPPFFSLMRARQILQYNAHQKTLALSNSVQRSVDVMDKTEAGMSPLAKLAIVVVDGELSAPSSPSSSPEPGSSPEGRARALSRNNTFFGGISRFLGSEEKPKQDCPYYQMEEPPVTQENLSKSISRSSYRHVPTLSDVNESIIWMSSKIVS